MTLNVESIKLFISRHLVVSVFVLSLLVSFGLFGDTITHPFLFDDVYLQNHGYLYTFEIIPKIFTSPHHFITSGVYRPAATLTYVFNRLFFGDSVVGFRIVQILLYAISGWVLFFVLKKLNFKNWQAMAAMLLFLFHPIHNETVNVIIFRHEIISTIFALWAILIRLSSPHLFLAYVVFFVAILSKETAIMILLAMLYILVFLNPDSLKIRFWQRIRTLRSDFIYSVSVVLFYFLIRFQVLGKLFIYDPTTIVENPLRHFSLLEGLLTPLKVIGTYVVKLIYPVVLSIDYSYNQIPAVKNFFNGWTLLGLGIFLLSVVVLLPWVKVDKKIKIAALFFLFPLLIVSNIFVKIGAITAERWLYLPVLGIAVLFVFAFEKLWEWMKVRAFKVKIIAFIPLLIIFSLYAFRNLARNIDWQSAFLLYESTAQASPSSVLARNNLAAMYLEMYDFEKTEAELKAATEIYPDYPHLVNNWGVFYLRKNELSKAKEYFLRTLELNPSNLQANENMVIILDREGNYKGALYYANQAYTILPNQKNASIIIYLEQKFDQPKTNL